jgi:segregation and condensation protein B
MKPEKKKELKNIVEGALLAAGRPLNVDEILALFSDEERPDRAEVKKALEALHAEFEGRGIELKEVASGFRIQVKHELAPWISRLWEERPARYSRALLETLALVAYRQPITRSEIEDVRGVTVSTHIMRTLQDRGWIRIVGHRDVPGHPEMFGTTKEFLDYFSLKSLDELPTLSQLRDIESINAELDLGQFDGMPAQAPVAAPRLADDESDAMDAGESGVTTH